MAKQEEEEEEEEDWSVCKREYKFHGARLYINIPVIQQEFASSVAPA
jgi:hypothetical protein